MVEGVGLCSKCFKNVVDSHQCVEMLKNNIKRMRQMKRVARTPAEKMNKEATKRRGGRKPRNLSNLFSISDPLPVTCTSRSSGTNLRLPLVEFSPIIGHHDHDPPRPLCTSTPVSVADKENVPPKFSAATMSFSISVGVDMAYIDIISIYIDIADSD